MMYLALAAGLTFLHAQDVPRLTNDGTINSVLIGPSTAIYSPPATSPAPFDGTLLVTSARRDLLPRTAARELAVPKNEFQHFANPAAFWELFWETRFHDYDARQSRWPVSPPKASKLTPVAGGDTVAGLEVMDTPGFTRGSVSYLGTFGGKKYAFTGDLIYDGGRIWDLYSLQDAIPDATTSTSVAGRNSVRGYHGFAARAADLMQSLRKIRDAKPDILIPARGPAIHDPAAAIDALLGRLTSLMREHFSTDALRWYWGDQNLRIRAAKMSISDPSWMEMAETTKLPDWVIPISNSKLIVSKSGGAYLIDCGYEKVYQEVEKLRQAGRFSKLEGIYVTHYHDDHTDFVAEASKRSGVPVRYVEEVGDVLQKPEAYRLPAMTRNPIHGEAMSEGAKRPWHEFDMEFAFFPGQTLYHGVMVLTNRDNGTRIVFGGDSFTPSGIDDYCLLNRNLVGENQGYLYCLRYLRKLGPSVFLTNQHVEPMWKYTPAQYDRMEASLRKRAQILASLFPWDSPNYGVDEQWARFYPYGVEAKPGASIPMEVRLTNHSARTREFEVTPHVPEGWKVSPQPRMKVTISPGQDGAARFNVQAPAQQATDSLTIVTADVTSNGMRLPDFVEAMVRVRK
ncbi:MAG: MBL fold metallo-hydrolase [Acidobacteria bacterium]|nr:MBL fold metallo-hydrolase [Acidobacteriota bacterium]